MVSRPQRDTTCATLTVGRNNNVIVQREPRLEVHPYITSLETVGPPMGQILKIL